MNILKRAIISISKRKSNSFILFIIIFILANVILTSLAVNTSLKNTKKNVLSQVPPIVTIDIDDSIWENPQNTTSIPSLTPNMVINLYNKTKKIVKSYDYTQSSGLVITDNFKEAELLSPEQKEQLNLEMNGTSIAQSGNKILPVTGTQASFKWMQSDAAEMIEGEGFKKKDIEKGNFCAVISKQLADTNGLEVGDKISLNQEIYSRTDLDSFEVNASPITPVKTFNYEFSVVGIIKINKVEEFISKANAKYTSKLSDDYFVAGYQANEIFIPNKALNKINEDSFIAEKKINPEDFKKDEQNGNSKPENLIKPQFVLKDIKYLKRFEKEAQALFPKGKYKITSASNSYDIIAKPLNTMEDLLNTIFFITVFATIIILALVLSIFMHLRQKELGIYLALGEKKIKIITQLLIETLIIILLGSSLAILTANIFSNILADNALQSLFATNAIPTNGGINILNTIEISPELINQQYSGGFSTLTILIFYGTMVTTVIISQLVSILYILRLNPKKILM